MKEITEYNAWPVSVVVCVCGGGGEEYRWVVPQSGAGGVKVCGATIRIQVLKVLFGGRGEKMCGATVRNVKVGGAMVRGIEE